MKFEVNIEKRYAVLILASVLILAGAIGIYAYTVNPGAIPNPGHALTSIQGYFDGDSNLETSLGKLCQADGTNCPGTLPYRTFDTGLFYYPTNLNCGSSGTGWSDDCIRGDLQFRLFTGFSGNREEVLEVRSYPDVGALEASNITNIRFYHSKLDPKSGGSYDCYALGSGTNSINVYIYCPGYNSTLDSFIGDYMRLVIEVLESHN